MRALAEMRPRSLLKGIAYRTLGRHLATSLNQRLNDAGSLLSYTTSPRGRRSAARLRLLQDRYHGGRCFIIGNGPSLKAMDLNPLRSETTFGLNRAYLMFETLGFPTTFLVAVNQLVIEQSGPEIVAAPVEEVFLAWAARRVIDDSPRPVLVRSLARPQFSADASRGVWEGATVTFVAMQLAYHFGFRDVILIGVDHSFVSTGPPHQVVTSSGPDANHFDADYFGPGYRWQLPDLETSEVAYRMARQAFEAGGGSIKDATVGGKLDVFPKVEYSSLFSGRSEVNGG
jgi:hypothetical protein